MKKTTTDYCVGCKLCEVYKKAELITDEKGFSSPKSGDQEWLDHICPIGNIPSDNYDFSLIWGRENGVFYGWSKDEEVRKTASSGGMLTEISKYLLRTGKADGIIHVEADATCQTRNNTTISYSEEEILSKAGSRYSISSPLDILDKIDITKKYVFIGKPCDIVALRNLQRIDSQIGEVLPILLSFFCMGLPSTDAQKKLLSALGTDDAKCCKLVYRGNGWPGYATTVNQDGSTKKIDYVSSWGKILGRDVMTACRFCLDGIGEAADISCGDAWYLEKGNKPDFSEREGRNVVFARTGVGRQILDEMNESGIVELEPIQDYEDYLSKVQYSQYIRRASMKSRVLAMRLFGRAVPAYQKKMLSAYSKRISRSDRIRAFAGTCKRIIKGGF